MNLPCGLAVLGTVDGDYSLRTRTAETVTVVSVGENGDGRRLIGEAHLTQTSLIALLDGVSSTCTLTVKGQGEGENYYV